MSRPSWTWTAAAAAALVGVVAAVLTAGASPARSDDGADEEHVPPSDFAVATTALESWDDVGAREAAIAEYVGAESRDAAFAPFEDPSYLDTH